MPIDKTHPSCENTPEKPLRQISSIQIRVPSNCFCKVKYTTWERIDGKKLPCLALSWLLQYCQVTKVPIDYHSPASVASTWLQTIPFFFRGGFSFTTHLKKNDAQVKWLKIIKHLTTRIFKVTFLITQNGGHLTLTPEKVKIKNTKRMGGSLRRTWFQPPPRYTTTLLQVRSAKKKII